MSSPFLQLSPVSARVSRSSRCRSEEHTSELQSQSNLVCRLLLEKKKKTEHQVQLFQRQTRSDLFHHRRLPYHNTHHRTLTQNLINSESQLYQRQTAYYVPHTPN